MASWRGWEAQLLRALRLPVSKQNIASLAEWQRHEGGTASYNPLNTTQRSPGASAYNSVGVRNYRTRQQGIQATVRTLRNGRYDDILGALSKNQPLGTQASLEVWGTGRFGVTRAGATGGAVAAPAASLTEGQAPASAPVVPSYTIQDAAMDSLKHLAAGDYDPTKALAAIRRAAMSTQTAALKSGGQNFGSMAIPVTGPQGSKFGNQAARLVQDYLGVMYRWGGTTPKGFDCSGLLQYVWAKLGVKIPRVTYDQWKAGRSIKTANLRPGDAVFFRPGPRGPEHVGMYIGGGQFVEAARTGTPVRISNLKGRSDFMGGRRYA